MRSFATRLVVATAAAAVVTAFVGTQWQARPGDQVARRHAHGAGRLGTVTVTTVTGTSRAAEQAGSQGWAATAPTPGSLYYGVHVPGWLNRLTQVTTFESHAGKRVSIVMFYQGWGVTDGTQDFQQGWMDNIRRHGSIPMVTWEPWVPGGGVAQPSYSLAAIAAGRYDAYVTRFALAAKSWGHPFFLRFAHEMNGSWYPWSEQTDGNTAGQYVQAWRHVHDVFAAHGADLVSWVWSPNVVYPGSTPLAGLYPGDAYVDWLGMDGYNWGPLNGHVWQSFGDVFGQTYAEVTALSPKPLLVAETASTELGGSKPQWITDALGSAILALPRVRGFVWFDEDKETDWRIESSAAAQTAFRRAVASSAYATNVFGSLGTKP